MRYQANQMEHSLHRKALRNEFIVAFMQPFGGMKELHQNLGIPAISELSSWNRMQKDEDVYTFFEPELTKKTKSPPSSGNDSPKKFVSFYLFVTIFPLFPNGFINFFLKNLSCVRS
ncbi:hypothetical protein AtEden1_Chr4g0305481 [Arabidopsis thaliana]